MTADAMTRLRDADPCPPGLRYDDATTERNIRAIVGAHPARTDPAGAECIEVLPGPVTGSRRPRRWAIVTVAAVLVVGAVTTGIVVARSGQHRTVPAADTWVRYHDTFSTISFDHPSQWSEHHAAFQSTVVYQDVWLSSVPFPDPCYSSSTAEGTVTEGCTMPSPDLRSGGVFVSWSTGNLPGTDNLVTDATGTVGGYPAHVERVEPDDGCRAARGTSTQINAVVAYPSPSQTTRMTACIGPDDTGTDVAAVDRMLASVRFG